MQALQQRRLIDLQVHLLLDLVLHLGWRRTLELCQTGHVAVGGLLAVVGGNAKPLRRCLPMCWRIAKTWRET